MIGSYPDWANCRPAVPGRLAQTLGVSVHQSRYTMSKLSTALENTLDFVQLLVQWATGWIVGLIVVASPLLIFALQSDAIGATTTSAAFMVVMLATYAAGVALALADLALRLRNKDNVFVAVRRAWTQIASSPAGRAMSPVAMVVAQGMAAAKAILLSALSLGFRALGYIVIAVIGSIIVYWFFGLLGTAPWWAVVIIVLLLVK